MVLMQLRERRSCVVGTAHEVSFSQPSLDGESSAVSEGELLQSQLDIALLPASAPPSDVPGALLPAASSSTEAAQERAIGANATCVAYAVKPGVVRVVRVLDQQAQQNAAVCRFLLPDPPAGVAGSRVAEGLALGQEKPQFLLIRDSHGLVLIYKGRLESPAPKPSADRSPSADAERGGSSSTGMPTAGGGTDTTPPFVQLQLQLEHGRLLDAFWLPSTATQRRAGTGAAETAERDRSETAEGGSGCFFVTVQQRRVAVWSVPLLRILGVTLRRDPQKEPLLAEEAEAADCCCCVLPLEEAAAAAEGVLHDPFNVCTPSELPEVYSACCASREGCLLVGLKRRVVAAWQLQVRRTHHTTVRLESRKGQPSSSGSAKM
ncbi:hypothetical protein cyc_09098 [Cyclospora cayetanensis]|uniref:Uncharacterized protein n=1 Tax=Cyclospora cayetanensis TaxID=88456 RepID=A0A1D3D8Q7_9EIME|nr:hypothetical protein cyc_09098 [Cyclospora cayetanensis]